jgi:hypothetical protein
MSRDRNAGRCHGVKIDNRSIERVEEFKYLGATLTDQNSIQDEIKSRFKLGNAYLVLSAFTSSRLLTSHYQSFGIFLYSMYTYSPYIKIVSIS